MSIAVVVLTYNRMHLLRQCVENVLLRTSPTTQEIVIWNNGSTDGTREYLDSLADPRLRIVHHPENIGQNAYALAFARTTSEYLVEVDDDVIDAPAGWDAVLLEAFERLPTIGYLAAGLRENELDWAASAIYGRDAHLYRIEEVEGVRLKFGPVGGACAITSRELHDRVGGFRQETKRVFWLEDAAYIKDVERLGYRAAYLEELKVLHAGGPSYGPMSAEKLACWQEYMAQGSRRAKAKQLIRRVPLAARLLDAI